MQDHFPHLIVNIVAFNYCKHVDTIRINDVPEIRVITLD